MQSPRDPPQPPMRRAEPAPVAPETTAPAPIPYTIDGHRFLRDPVTGKISTADPTPPGS